MREKQRKHKEKKPIKTPGAPIDGPENGEG